MGFLDGIKKLTQPFDDEDDFYDDDEMETPIPVETPSGNYEQPERKSSFFSGSNENIQQQAERPYASNPSPRPRRESRNNKVVDLGTGGQHMKVVLINPENFEAAAEIAENSRSVVFMKHGVIMFPYVNMILAHTEENRYIFFRDDMPFSENRSFVSAFDNLRNILT